MRSDKHAPAACTALAVIAVQAVLADVTAGTPAAHGGGQSTELDAGIVRQLRPGRSLPTRITSPSARHSYTIRSAGALSGMAQRFYGGAAD